MLKFCGINKSQFGENPNNTNSFENPINSPPMNSKFAASSIISFSSYYFHTVLITKAGATMIIGNNSKGTISGSLLRQIITNFTKYDIKDQNGRLFFPLSAVCGESYTLYLVSNTKEFTKNMLVYSYAGIKTDSPLFLNVGEVNPIALFGGFSHSAAIDDEGSIIFIPKSIFKAPTKKIEPVCLPDDEKAVSIACCNHQLFAVGSNYGVFVSNITETGGNAFKPSFSRIKSLDGKRIVEVSGTYGHCIAVSEDGSVFGFGSNYDGQLCFDKEIYEVTEFTKISSLNKYKVVNAYAGTTHSLFQTNEGKILASGENSCGQLFSDKPSKVKVYNPIETEIKGGANFCVTGDSCSYAFIDSNPLMSPNRRITADKFKKKKN